MNESHTHFLNEGERAGSRYALSVPSRVPTGLAGLQLGQHAGASLEFKDHRDYQPGDDLRRIDWSAYARSDKLIVKLYREEVNPHLDILLDGSTSMALQDSAKAQAALGVTAALVAAATNAGYSHQAYIAHDGCAPIAHGSDRPGAWDEIRFTGAGHPEAALLRAPPAWRGQGIRVLVSDLLWMGEPNTTLDHLAAGSAAVYVVQVLARADVEPPQRGNVRLVDCESGELKEVFVDAIAERRYHENLARHQENWNLAARAVGATMTTIVAEDIVKNWDLEALVAAEVLTVN